MNVLAMIDAVKLAQVPMNATVVFPDNAPLLRVFKATQPNGAVVLVLSGEEG